MNPFRNPARLGLALAASIALGSAACDNSTAPINASLSKGLADSMASVFVADAQGEIDFPTASGAVGFAPGAAPAAVGPALAPPPACVSLTPASPTNSDGDRVPDSVRLTFNDCAISYIVGSDTVRGSIDVVDPTPSATDHAVKHVFTDLARIHVGALGREASITLNGSRQIQGDSAVLALTSVNFRTDYLWPNGTSASHVRSWTVTFSADTAGTIQPDAELPHGSLSIQGNSSWTRGSNTWSIVASTPTPLHFDPTCGVRPMFDAGTFQAVVTRNSATTNLTIQFTACGTYTVTRS
jgi:hypothetical protein